MGIKQLLYQHSCAFNMLGLEKVRVFAGQNTFKF